MCGGALALADMKASSATWLQVINYAATSSRIPGFWQLADQYIAAYLTLSNAGRVCTGTDVNSGVSVVDQVMLSAYSFFTGSKTCSVSKTLANSLISWASVLDTFNNGGYTFPPHCGSEGYSLPTSGALVASATGGTSPYTYSWNPTAGTTNVAIVQQSQAGIQFTVTVKDSKNCTATATGTVQPCTQSKRTLFSTKSNKN
jgi:hypothetical protein